MDETKLIGRLPYLDVEITRRDLPEQGAESVAILLRAAPSFYDVGRWLAEPGLATLSTFARNPLGFWMAIAGAAWQPWLSLAAQFMLPPRPRE
ncbi:MAG TPA: hypothetical protein VKY65_17810 [Alphaproteobacteria bacterium]|nr:hypothetical protein [Alphaproteobacteria bacterium]